MALVFGSMSGLFFADQFQESAQEGYRDTALVSVFGREECVHCQDEKAFLESWQQENPELDFQILDVEANDMAQELFEEITTELQLSKSTPVTVLGEMVFVGFDSAEGMGARMQEYFRNQTEIPSFGEIIDQHERLERFSVLAPVCEEDSEECAVAPLLVSIPFWGDIDVSTFQSPAVLSFVLGFIDGFNPCAMWVLVLFLLALLQIGDRFRMFLTVGIFLLAEAVMYTLILTVWLTTWNFVGLEAWITPLVGFVAIGAGFFFLFEGLFSDGTCAVTNTTQRRKISQKIQAISTSPLTIPTLLAILALAFSVNIIEFACSFGIPQTFTQILHLSGFTIWEQAGYIALYILAYMIDDLIVFGIALYSVSKIGVTQKYAKASNVLGGILMLLLGALLIFAPEFLAFA